MPAQEIIPHAVANSLVELLKERIERPPMEYHEYATPEYVPDANDLMMAINYVFWASMEVEEGRQVLPRVLLGDIHDDLCSIEPVPLDVRSLRKLSPFLDDRRNFFQCTDIKEALHLVGVGKFNPMNICVHAERPGSLVVSHVGRAIALLDNGTWSMPDLSQEQLAAGLQSIFEGEYDSSRKNQKAYLLIRIANLARNAKRGAMFISTPPSVYDGIDILNASCRISSFGSGRDALAKAPSSLDVLHAFFSKDPEANERHDELQQEVQELRQYFVRVVASGSGIDGATLLDSTDLRVVAFGVKILTPPEKAPVRIRTTRLSDNNLQDVPLKELGGMRHQSAARLVDFNHDASVVTVSQDGNVSLFLWDEDLQAVVALRGLEDYLRNVNEVYYG